MTDIVPAGELPPTVPVEIPVAPTSPGAPSLNTPVLASQAPADPMLDKPKRLLSLDVFRGLTLAMMTLVNNDGPGKAYAPLDHAAWGQGWTPTDLVFPFFLFIVGVAIPFSLNKRSSIGQTKRNLLGTIWTRALALFMVGQLLQGISNLHLVAPLPSWFHVLPAMRWVVVVYCYVAIIALLIPFKFTRKAWVLPVAICVNFYALAVVMGLLNHNALSHGLTDIHATGLVKPAAMRIPGILQRIGLCYGIGASIILYTGWRTALLTVIGVCALYLALMFNVPFHNADTGKALTGTVTEEHNLARTVDESVFDRFARGPDGKRLLDKDGDPTYVWHHTYSAYPDNEGIISTLPAIANVLIGAMAGLWLRTIRPAGERCAGLFVFGVIVLLLGYWLDAHTLPINKTIWTPAYAILTAGLALMGLGICYYTVDIHGYRRWAFPFVVLGMNSIAVFVANNFLYRVNTNFEVHNPYAHSGWSTNHDAKVSVGRVWGLSGVGLIKTSNDWLAHHVSKLAIFDTPQNTSLIYAVSFVFAVFLLMLILYACKIFVKI